MTLTEFLAARLDEDEAAARPLIGMPAALTAFGAVAQFIARTDPARVLREVDAKRAILAMETDTDSSSQWSGWADAHGTALEYLAAVYSDHPDYDKTWSPR